MDIVKSEINMANEVELCVEVGSNIGDTLLENSDINQLCRTCANTHDNMIPIFEGDGLEHDLQNKIDKHFPVNISKDDGLPNKMCFQCASTLVAWHDMFTGCIEAEKKLKHLLDKLKDDGQVGESVFGSSVVSEDSASDNLKAQQKTGSEMEIDNDDGNDDDYAPEHGGDDDDEDDDDEEEEEEDEEDDDLETEVVLHKLDAKEKEKTVEVSEKGTTIRDQMKDVSKESSEVQPTASMLQRIGEVVSSAEPPINPSVGENYRGVIGRKRKPVKHQCEYCDKLCYSNHVLNEHRRTHTREKPFACKACGITFSHSSSLYRHTKAHCDERPYVCEVCKKGFKCNQTLQRHISIHTGERNFICDACGKDFRLKNDLNIHLATHNSEPFYCQICRKEFNSSTTLKRHLRLHDNTNAYSCPMCSAIFHQRRYLGDHLRTKHKVTLTEVVKSGENIEWQVRDEQLL